MIQICGLQKNTLIDFPGRVAATVFLCGCNFHCPWCYSREIVLPDGIKNQPRVSEKEFFTFLKERKGLLDGVVICGGEPTMHSNLPRFIKKIKKLSFLVKLDTNGSNPQMLNTLLDKKLIDYAAMDVKLPKERYKEILGIDVEKIGKSIKILKGSKIDYEFRSTIVPTIHTKKDVIKMAKWVKGAKKYYLQNFRPEKTIDPKFEKIKPYPEEFLKEIQQKISPFFTICGVR